MSITRAVLVLSTILILSYVPVQGTASTNYSVFPSSINLGYYTSNFTQLELEGNFTVRNLDPSSSLDLQVYVSNIPKGTYITIPNTVTVDPNSEKIIFFTLHIPPNPGRFVLSVRMEPEGNNQGSGTTAVPIFEGKVSYVVGGHTVSSFSVSSHSSKLPFTAAVVLESTSLNPSIATMSLDIYSDQFLLLSQSIGSVQLGSMQNTTEPSVYQFASSFTLDEQGIFRAVLSVIFENSTMGYYSETTREAEFISGTSKPLVETGIYDETESGFDYATAEIHASNLGDLPYLLTVLVNITIDGEVVNSYSSSRMISNEVSIIQPLLFGKTGIYRIVILGKAGDLLIRDEREIEILGFGEQTTSQTPDIVSNLIQNEDSLTRYLIYLILILIVLILLAGFALILKQLLKKEKKYLPDLPDINDRRESLGRSVRESMGQISDTTIRISLKPIDVKLSKIHIFLTSGEALATYDIRSKTLTDLSEIALTDMIVALRSIDPNILEFIPLRKNSQNSIYIHVIGELGFGVELEDDNDYQKLQESETLKKALETFYEIHKDTLTRGLVDLEVSSFKKIFRFKR